MAKGCVYIVQTGKDAGKVFGSKDSLAAHMNYTPAMAELMAKYEKSGGKMDVGSVTNWLTDNGYLKAEGKKPTSAPKPTEGTKKETPGVSVFEKNGLEILNKYGVARFTEWLSNQPLLGGFSNIRDIANKYGIKFPQTEKEFDAEVKKNGGIDNYMGSMADTFISKMTQPSTEKKPTVKKEFPKAPVTDAVKAALKSVDNTTMAVMNLAKNLPTVYESIAKQVKLTLGKPASQQIAEAYHNAVENGVEPELIAAVENGVALQEQMKSKPSLVGEVEATETLEMDGVPTGVRVSNKASMADLERKHAGNAVKKATIAMARSAAKTLKSVFPMMDIHLHENTADYQKAMAGLNGQKNSKGNFAYTTSSDGTVVGRIDINLSLAQPSTVVHEVAHAIMLKTFGENPSAFTDFRKNLEKIISASGNKRLSDFADKYKEIANDIGQAEEYLAELAGILSDKETPLSYGVVRNIAELINKAVSAITFGRLKPFENLQNQKDTLEYFNNIAQAIKTGSSIDQLMVSEPYSQSIAIEVDPDGTFTKSKINSKAAIGDYIIPKGKKDLAIATVPTKTLAEVIKQYNGRVVIITSDATGYGVDSKGREIYGGPGFANNLKNVNDEIGFASLNIGTVKSVYTSADKAYGKGKTLVLIMVQPPHTTINNSYGTQYFMESLIDISKNENWNEIKADVARLIREGKGIKGKFPEKTRARDIERLINFFNNINPESNADALTKEYLEITGFQSRSKIAKTFILDQPNTRINVKSAKTKKAFLDNGVTIYDFLKEYGDDTILTDEMMRNDEGGYVVAGFEIDVTSKAEREALIEKTQGKGIEHPLFNAKLPGTNHFVLDGLYDVNENFAQYAKPNMEITLPDEELNQIVREQYPNIDDYKADVRKEADKINKDKKLSKEEKQKAIEELKVYKMLPAAKKISLKEDYLSKIQGALTPVQADVATSVAGGKGFVPIKGADKKLKEAQYTKSRELPPSKIASKASLVYDETGFITTDSMIEIVKANDPTYLGDVMNHILDMGEKLRSGNVGPKDLAKAYMMAVSSIQSKDQPIRNFENAIGEKVDEVFVEKERGTIRPEGAMAYLLTTPEGKRMLENINRGKIDAKDRAFIANSMRPFGMFGEGQSKFDNLFGAPDDKQINLTNINEFADILKGGVKDEQKFFNDITKLKGISQAKVGFVTNFLGIGTRGVIDTREIKGWLRGVAFMDDFTESEAVMNKQLTKSLKNLTPLQKEILRRMRVVGDAFGIDPIISEYIGHHMIWDAVKDERTTHDGLYLAMKQNENEFADRLAEIKARPAIKSKAQIFGETGATRMENAEKVLNNLQVAKDMEAKFEKEERTMSFVAPSKSTENAQKIRLATGWEKGADGLWRLEIPDGKLKPIDLDEMFKSAGNVPSAYLDEIYDSKELYDAYPTARDLRVFFIEADNYKGSYNQKKGEIELAINNFDEPIDMLSTLLHEVQHHIQHVEGFAKGSDSAIVVDQIKYELSQIGKQVEAVNQEMKEPAADIAKLQEKKAELENKGKKLNQQVSKLLKSVQIGMSVQPKGPAEQKAFVDLLLKDSDVKKTLYHTVAGEVEARNVQNRMGLSEEERLNKLLSSTEGVLRSDQLILGAALRGETPAIKSKAQLSDTNAKEVTDLYAKMREGGGWAERQKINAILDQDPKLSYIYNNFKAITQMLEEAELLTKSGNCP